MVIEVNKELTEEAREIAFRASGFAGQVQSMSPDDFELFEMFIKRLYEMADEGIVEINP